jgi:hypothetical protein
LEFANCLALELVANRFAMELSDRGPVSIFANSVTLEPNNSAIPFEHGDSVELANSSPVEFSDRSALELAASLEHSHPVELADCSPMELLRLSKQYDFAMELLRLSKQYGFAMELKLSK